jgi:hypothetical protein
VNPDISKEHGASATSASTYLAMQGYISEEQNLLLAIT